MTETSLPARQDFTTITPPLALGPLDGRYHPMVAPLVNDVSEAALNRNRLRVEVEWLIHLVQSRALPGVSGLSVAQEEELRRVVQEFGADGLREMAETEKAINHDVKAVEYYLKDRMRERGMGHLAELVHFACTSEDISNLAYALGVRDAIGATWLPAARALVADLSDLARRHRDVPMLARTHGQPATPTTLGKELAVAAHRLNRQAERIEGAAYLGKINGATGTYAAHVVAVPGTDWEEASRTFVEKLGLEWNPLTTQIEPHDWQGELYGMIAQFNRILHNLCSDVWTYISLGYFVQRPQAGEVGSSTMPHKINPIRFENAEANLEISNALLDNLSATLATSRMQRDLTDSSTQRTIGIALGHSLVALSNVRRGLSALDIDESMMRKDLEENWEVLGEAIQTVMRALAAAGAPNMENPYERLKELTRGQRVDGPRLRAFIAGLDLPPAQEEALMSLEPAGYTGLASRLVDHLPGAEDGTGG